MALIPATVQALADIAVFLGYVIAQYNLPPAISVVTFGGSYAGEVSAFFRTKYPNLAIGAVASSAPVQAKLDFGAFQDVVAASFMTSDQGSLCLNNIESATTAIYQLLKTSSGRQQLVWRS